MYKVPYSPSPGGWAEVYKVCGGRISSCEERKPEYLGFWIEYNVEKRESNIIFNMYINAVGNIIKWGRREGDGNFFGEKQKMVVGNNIMLF